MSRVARACCLMLVIGSCTTPRPTPDAGSTSEALTLTALTEFPATLLSVWEKDGVLFAVGGTNTRSFVLRHDSNGWWEMDPGTDSALWWVHGLTPNDVYAVGVNGVITHFDGVRWTVEREGGDYTLYGVWGTSSSNLLAVGGNVTSSRARGVVLSQASGWTETITAIPSTTPLFKIWGTSIGDYWVAGERGLLAHGGIGGLRPETVLTQQRLTTVSGSLSNVYAVGGSTEPVALTRRDQRWESVALPGDPSVLNGVAVNASGTALVVGFSGYAAVSVDGGAFVIAKSGTTRDLHAAFAMRDGFVAVGGDLLGTFEHGVLVTNAPSLMTTGPLRPWAERGVRFDAGVDAGIDAGPIDAGPPIDAGEDAGLQDAGLDGGPPEPDGGWLTEGALCDGRYTDCRAGLECWFVFGPFKSYCAALCNDVSQCGAYGANACCKVPGPQVMTPVCLPEVACDGGN